MKPTIAVAVSGGLDSMMAAYILKEEGHPVFGIHFITGFEAAAVPRHCPSDDSRHPVLDIGKQLGIPIHLIDIKPQFQQSVVDHFVRTYRAGQTPNPCMICNPAIKFGIVLSFARQLGAERLATGHYARIQEEPSGHFRLLKGIDSEKDQSYFLARLTQNQLARACFPLGKMRKAEIKLMAGQKGLHPITEGESQDVCFIRSKSYGEFLSSRPIGDAGFEPRPGPIENTAGKIIGQHGGLHLFTIGQRRGINCPAPRPYYVVRLDTRRNCLVVGSKRDLQSNECEVADVNWIGEHPISPMTLKTRVRYRSEEVPSTVYPQCNHRATVRFHSPQTAITPGQGAVFYRGDEILGGGWITNVHG
jgi:tRNA-uridine 2-sulfurtransferase